MLKTNYHFLKRFIITAFLSIIFLISFATHNNCTEGGDIPSFSLESLQGERLKLSDLKDRVTIVDFWATWCPPCRDLIPNLSGLYKEYQSKGVNIIGIAVSSGSVKKIRNFVKRFKITYPILIGSKGEYKNFGSIRALPTVFILNQNGEIHKKYVGYVEKKCLDREIKKLLEESR
ncbi:MAG: TlpA disulfide reductase family protein [Thermodesulfobacteriota bacterium]|nr:TlpA disulfide reductase family protein [Thermodesulfobacteriota bacterium]